LEDRRALAGSGVVVVSAMDAVVNAVVRVVVSASLREMVSELVIWREVWVVVVDGVEGANALAPERRRVEIVARDSFIVDVV